MYRSNSSNSFGRGAMRVTMDTQPMDGNLLPGLNLFGSGQRGPPPRKPSALLPHSPSPWPSSPASLPAIGDVFESPSRPAASTEAATHSVESSPRLAESTEAAREMAAATSSQLLERSQLASNLSANPETRGPLSLKALTLKIQSQVMGKGTSAAPLKKGNVKSVQKKTKKGPKSVKDMAGSLMNRPAARTSKRSKDDDSLIYRPVKDSSSPRYYGEITIYTDTNNNVWRIKSGCGVRIHKKIAFGKKPREQWAKVVKWVKEL